MNKEYRVTDSQEKAYEVKARQFFIDEIFPSEIFQNFMRNGFGMVFLTKEGSDGKLELPETIYNPHNKSVYLDSNNQLSIENLRALTSGLHRYVNNEDFALKEIGQSSYYSIINKKEGNQKVVFEDDVKDYQIHGKEGKYLSNHFFSILKKGKKEETEFTRQMRRRNGEKQLVNNVNRAPPSAHQRRSLDSLLKKHEYNSPLSGESFEIEENLCKEKYTLPFSFDDQYGVLMNETLSLIKDVEKIVPKHHVYPITINKPVGENDIPSVRYGLMIMNNELNPNRKGIHFTDDGEGNIMTRDWKGATTVRKALSQTPLIIDPLEKKVSKASSFGGEVLTIFLEKAKPADSTTLEPGEQMYLGLDKGSPVFLDIKDSNSLMHDMWKKMHPEYVNVTTPDEEFPSGVKIMRTSGFYEDGIPITHRVYDLFNPTLDSELENNPEILNKIHTFRNSLPTKKVFITPEDYDDITKV